MEKMKDEIKNDFLIEEIKEKDEEYEEDIINSIDLDSSSKKKILNNFITKDNFKDKYEELPQLKDIIKHICEINNNNNKNTICFFDIQGVLIKNNNYHEALAAKKFEQIFYDLCSKYKYKEKEICTKIARFGRFYESRLTEDSLPQILNNLNNQNVELCLLTFARYSKDRENALKNHGILDRFTKQIWTGGISKGTVMMEYLKSKKDLNNLNIIFVDDKLTHLKSVYESISKQIIRESTGFNSLKLFLYNRDPVLPVSEEDFKKFWEKVIKQYKDVQYNTMNNKRRY